MVIIDSPHACSCICLEKSVSLKSCGDVGFSRKSVGRRQYKQVGSLNISCSLASSRKQLQGTLIRSSRKLRKVRRPVIRSNLGGQYEESFEDVKKQLLKYFTYKAVRTVLNQLYEMNPPQYTWLYNYVVANNPGDGKEFIRNLGKEQQGLAERVMVTRLHLYGKWIKKCNHAEIYEAISDENLELMRERLLETIIWPSDDTNTNTETIG